MLCETTFWRGRMPAAVAILMPSLDDPSKAIASGICEDCTGRYPTYETLKPALLAVCGRELGLTDLREIVLHDDRGGHA
jgi:hypothetical protein